MNRMKFTNDPEIPWDAMCPPCNGRGWHGMVNTKQARCYECSGTGRTPIPFAEVFPNWEEDQQKELKALQRHMIELVKMERLAKK